MCSVHVNTSKKQNKTKASLIPYQKAGKSI